MACVTEVFNKIAPLVVGQQEAIFASVFAQFTLGYIVYGSVFQAAWQRNMSVDKGVKDINQVKSRHHISTCLLTSVFSYLVRAIATILLVLTVGKITSLCSCMEAAALVFVMELGAVHHYFWSQAPFAMFFIDQVNNVACGAVSAAMIYVYYK
jgi:hypothetical protein